MTGSATDTSFLHPSQGLRRGADDTERETLTEAANAVSDAKEPQLKDMSRQFRGSGPGVEDTSSSGPAKKTKKHCQVIRCQSAVQPEESWKCGQSSCICG